MAKYQSIEQYKVGHFESRHNYKYLVPSQINYQWTWDDVALNTLLERASIKLGELNSFGRLVPNIDLFIQMHVTKEAVISSRIEGTQTSIDESLLPVEEIKPERKNDWLEVRNYTVAMNNAIEQLNTLPLSSRLLRKAHKELMAGVRGAHKQPGEFRNSQNWIGGASLSDAVYIPPAEHYVNVLMSDLENFLHNREVQVPALIRIALAHYQFETIHPFLEGNGRIGRLLITLYLVSEKILERPLLYLSAFFEKDRSLYYEYLSKARINNDLLSWTRYFLQGVEETASNAVETLNKILSLKVSIEDEIKSSFGRRSNSGQKLLEHLFRQPVINVKDVEFACSLSTKAANDLVASFEERKWLVQIGDSERYRRFRFETYLKLFE
jgi:Fic family protein